MSVSPSVEAVAPGATPSSARPRNRGWSTRRIVSVLAGGMLGLASIGMLSAGGWATWMTNTQRDPTGYFTTSARTVAAAGPAVTSGEVGELADRVWGGMLGNVRIRARSTDPNSGVFIGVAPTAAVDRYLAGADHTSVTGWFPVATRDVAGTGTAVATAPTDARIWTAQVSGADRQALTWRPASRTTVVVMHPDGSAGVSAAIDFGAQGSGLVWFAVGCFAIGALLLGAAIALIVGPVRRTRG